MVAGDERHARTLHQRLGLRLAAHRLDRCRLRADEDEAGLRAGLCEPRVLREEAVARVDGLRAGAACRLDDGVAAQVALPRRRGTDRVGLVGRGHVQRVGVRLGVDGHGGDTHAARGGDDAAGDLAPVGDQDLVEHPRHILNRPKRVGSIGAFIAAEIDRPSTRRVCAGSITPSSHSLADA